MITLATQPTINELYGLINRVPTYPLSVARLIKLARDTGASKEVVVFYKAFGDDQIFDDEEDLAARTEQVKIMRVEQIDMPAEQMVAPEEY